MRREGRKFNIGIGLACAIFRVSLLTYVRYRKHCMCLVFGSTEICRHQRPFDPRVSNSDEMPCHRPTCVPVKLFSTIHQILDSVHIKMGDSGEIENKCSELRSMIGFQWEELRMARPMIILWSFAKGTIWIETTRTRFCKYLTNHMLCIPICVGIQKPDISQIAIRGDIPFTESVYEDAFWWADWYNIGICAVAVIQGYIYISGLSELGAFYLQSTNWHLSKKSSAGFRYAEEHDSCRRSNCRIDAIFYRSKYSNNNTYPEYEEFNRRYCPELCNNFGRRY